MSHLIRVVEDSIEFFTVETTGESGMSESGLARLCGVTRKAVNNVLQSVSTSSCSDFLKVLQDIELTLSTSSEYKNASVLRDEVCTLILEWYAFESQRPSEVARQSYRKFAKLGMRVAIQQITGWQPPQQKQLKAWKTQRLDGKITHFELTDAIAVYITRHPELSENARKWIYTNTAQAVNLAIFNRKAKALAEDLGVDPKSLRDALERKELLYVQQVEDTAARMILLFDANPVEAVKEAFSRLLIPKQERSLLQSKL
jgi:transcriptional regulator with XRE-family HTH domain